MGKVLVAPNGLEIKGTLERIQGIALISNVQLSRKGEFTFEWAGETEVDWNSQVTVTRPNPGLKTSGTHGAMSAAEIVFVDTDGNEWVASDLQVVDEKELEKSDA